jgi:23S rRNA pseudouridine1911/1915/1917 synthase
MKIELTAPDSANGLRLDKYLGTVEAIQSRSRALQLIESGVILVNNKPAKASLTLRGGELITVEIPEAAPTELQPLELNLEILFEDSSLIVLNKPPGLVVHPAAGHAQDTLVNALVAHTEDFTMKFGDQRPGIVHRLDKDTSGIMVVAKTDAVQEHLSQQFKDRTIHRHYLAVVCGLMKQSSGSVKSFLARHPTDRKRFASVRGKDKKILVDIRFPPAIGKWAHTDFQVVARHPSGLSYVKLKLHTGRTHQIRVHLSELGFPILGDETYGGVRKNWSVPRFALHAAELGFTHPISGESLYFEKSWPEDYQQFILEHFGGSK